MSLRLSNSGRVICARHDNGKLGIFIRMSILHLQMLKYLPLCSIPDLAQLSMFHGIPARLDRNRKGEFNVKSGTTDSSVPCFPAT